MDSEPRHMLANLLQKEGVGLVDDPQRIKAHLLDACPESRTETELLVAGAADGLAARLARSSDTVFRDGEIARAVADLKRTRRLDRAAAEWVVLSWAWALGVIDEEPSDEEPDSDGATPPTGSVYTAPSSAPPQFEPPSPRSAPPYEQTTPASAQSGAAAAVAPPQSGGTASSPLYGSSSAPPYGHVSAPPSGANSAPPWGPETSVPPQSQPSAPPFGSDPTYGGTRPAWGPGSSGQPPPNAPWSEPPFSAYSGAHASGAGGIPPTGPAAPAQPPPSNGRRGWIIGLVAAAVLAIVAVTVALVLPKGGDTSTPPASSLQASAPAPNPQASAPAPNPQGSAPAAPSQSTPTTDPLPAQVNYTITSYITDIEAERKVTVYSQGQEVGTLDVTQNSPSDSLPVTGPPGGADYSLEMTVDFNDGTEITLGGTGTLNAYEGAEYTVDLQPIGTSDYEATLTEN